MILNLVGPFPNETVAYHKDGSDDEYYGRASKRAKTSDARWMIAKQEYDGDNWIIKYPDGSDEPKFVWDDVESYTYKLLGT